MWEKRCKSHQLRLGIAPPARFGGAMRRSRAIAKKHAFLYVFSRAAKISKWHHFRQYRRIAVMFEQAKLQGTQMGPNGPPNAKGTA